MAVDDVGGLLRAVARGQIQYHAGRVCCATLDAVLGDHRWPPPPSPATHASQWGYHEWLDYFRGESERIRDAHPASADDAAGLVANIVDNGYDQALAVAKEAVEDHGDRYRRDMSGKDLFSGLSQELQRQMASRASAADLAEAAAESLGACYRPGLFDPDDFAELSQRLTAPAPPPALRQPRA